MKQASEDVIEAAIRLPDGCVFTGNCHAFALEKAYDEGYSYAAKEYARCTAAKERAKMPSATHANALVMRRQR